MWRGDDVYDLGVVVGKIALISNLVLNCLHQARHPVAHVVEDHVIVSQTFIHPNIASVLYCGWKEETPNIISLWFVGEMPSAPPINGIAHHLIEEIFVRPPHVLLLSHPAADSSENCQQMR
jgi:hypothetical protein